MDLEGLVGDISTKTGLSTEEVLVKIKNKQSELSGLVSDEGAAYIVANELGVETKNRVLDTNLNIKEIMPEMRSVTVLGRVQGIIGPREFTTKKGAKSKVANLRIVDKTGNIGVVLWNMSDIEKIEKEELKIGNIIQVKNGYVKEGFRGGLEVNLGSRGMLITDPEDVNEDDFPKSESADLKINQVTPGIPVNLLARVTRNFGVKEFTRKDGSPGKVGTLIIGDGTGTTRFVLWNDKADLAGKVNIGDIVKIDNAYSKEGLNGVEVQANTNTMIGLNPEGVELPGVETGGSSGNVERIKISDLKDGDTYKELRGALVNVFDNKLVFDMCPNCKKALREGKCEKCGEVQPDKLLIVNAVLDDGSGTIHGAFFRNAAETLLGMKTEDVVNDTEKAKTSLSSLLGKERLLEGRVKRNEVMDRLEFNVFSVKEVNAKEEAESMAKEIGLYDKNKIEEKVVGK